MSERTSHPALLRTETFGTFTDSPVRKSVRVAASIERAFAVFTTEIDRWWPRTICMAGSSIDHVAVEGRPGGAVFSRQEDGTICPWGTVLDWDPPHRLVMAWQLSPEGLFEPDLAKASEIEVTFRQTDGSLVTAVELEHRGLERHKVVRIETDAMPDGEACRRHCFDWTLVAQG